MWLGCGTNPPGGINPERQGDCWRAIYGGSYGQPHLWRTLEHLLSGTYGFVSLREITQDWRLTDLFSLRHRSPILSPWTQNIHRLWLEFDFVLGFLTLANISRKLHILDINDLIIFWRLVYGLKVLLRVFLYQSFKNWEKRKIVEGVKKMGRLVFRFNIYTTWHLRPKSPEPFLKRIV